MADSTRLQLPFNSGSKGDSSTPSSPVHLPFNSPSSRVCSNPPVPPQRVCARVGVRAHARGKPSADEADRLLHWMPILVQSEGLTEWERKFCASMIARSKKARFIPSRKQAAVMERIVRQFQERSRDDVIEGDEQ